MENNPERTCIVCRKKDTKDKLFRVVKRGTKYLYDKEQKFQARGAYICKTHECVKRLSKHRKFNVEISELSKMLDDLKNSSKDYLNVLRAMRTSEYLTFGMNMVLEGIEQTHFIVIAEDISDKNDRKITTIAKEKNINYVHFGTREELGEIFGKSEVTVVGVKNKKVARGLIE